MLQTGKLPQICLMTLWGAPNPLVAKVKGVYKYSVLEDKDNADEISAFQPSGNVTYYSLTGQPLSSPAKGINIVRQSDGSVKKVVVNH